MRNVQFRRTLAHAVAAASAALALAGASPALAGADRRPRPEAEITPEAEALGVQLARQMFETTDFETYWVRRLARPLTAQRTFGLKQEPGWETPRWEAVAEEFHHDLPALERLVGREFARGMPIDQLKANVEFLSGRNGALMLQYAFDKTLIETAPSETSLEQAGLRLITVYKTDINVTGATDGTLREIKRFLSSHEGQSYLVLLQRVESRMEKKMLDELAPGVAERFNAKMEAVRRARPAGG